MFSRNILFFFQNICHKQSNGTKWFPDSFALYHYVYQKYFFFRTLLKYCICFMPKCYKKNICIVPKSFLETFALFFLRKFAVCNKIFKMHLICAKCFQETFTMCQNVSLTFTCEKMFSRNNSIVCIYFTQAICDFPKLPHSPLSITRAILADQDGPKQDIRTNAISLSVRNGEWIDVFLFLLFPTEY